MKTAEAKPASVASSQRVNRPFFPKGEDGSFFGEHESKKPYFFKPASAYRINRNGLLQTKLTIGQPGDKYEKEADATADKVVQKLSEPGIRREIVSPGENISPLIQQKCAHCEEEEKKKKEDNPAGKQIRRKPIFDSDADRKDEGKSIQKKCAECEKEEKLQKKSDTTPSSSPSNIESTLNSSKGSGSSLPKNTQSQMESAFGTDFSRVRIHTNSSAIQMNNDLHAQAFTHGSDIYFNSGKYDANSTGGKHLLAHELTHVVQQGELAKTIRRNSNPPNTGLPTVDPAVIPPIWSRTPLEPSGGIDVFVYRGVASKATERLASGVLAEDAIGGVLSRRIDAAHDAIFNVVGRDPVLTGPNSGGVIRIKIPATVWDELVRTNSISERSYPGFSRQLTSTEIRVNSNEAVRLINTLTKDIVAPDPYYDFRPGAIRPASPTPVEAVPITATPQNFQIEANYEVLSTTRVPGSNNTVAEVQVLLGNGLDDLNRSVTLSGADRVPNRMIIRITISPEGALLAAESAAGEPNALVQFLARGATQSIPRTPGVSPWVRGVGWAGLALFIGITWYRYHNASEEEKPRILARAGGGLAAGMVGGYIVCNLVLGIETLGWSLVICGFLVGIPAGMAGEAIADVAYDEATIDDDEIREYTANSSLEQIRVLPFTEKVRLIFSLMKGWVSEEDIVAIERICLSVNNASELSTLRAVVEPQLINLTSIGQRTRVRVAFARRIQPRLTTGRLKDKCEQEADSVADALVQSMETTEKEQKNRFNMKHKTKKVSVFSNIQAKSNAQEDGQKVSTQTNNYEKLPSSAFKLGKSSSGVKENGNPLSEENKVQMSNFFGVDFSTVRIHTGATSVKMNRDLNAQAFTHGGDIYFNEGKYDPNSREGTRLLAHELTHVVQQQSSSQIKRTPEEDSAGSCPTYEPDEVVKSRTVAGWLPQDLTEHNPNELLFADFGNNQSNVRRSSQAEALWISWRNTFNTDGSYRISIVGYSDCSGNEEVNTSIRQARALAAERALGSGINNKLSFRGMAGLGQMVTTNDTPENRARNRGVIIKYKQGFFFDSEAFENAKRANDIIQNALTELSTSSEARERNVPAYIKQRGISIGPLTPRHDTTTTTPDINFFAGTSDYANSFVLPSSARFHIYNNNAGIGIQIRVMPDLIGIIPLTEVKERIVQAVSQIAHLTAVGTAVAGTTTEQYKAQFNAWWNVAPYNTINTEFNLALNSFGPRTNRAREIFEKIYNENTSVQSDYDNNTGGIKEKIDTYNIPEGFNLINSSRLQALRVLFSVNVPPISNANYPAFKTAVETAATNLDSDDRIAVSSANDWQRLINQYITDESKRQEIRNAINTPPIVPSPPPAPAPTPGPSSGGGASARDFLNNVSIDGPIAPITANNATETVTLTPLSTKPNPGLNFATKFTVTPAPRVIGNNISPESAWPSGVNSGISFDPEISNNGNITMNARLDLVEMPSGITPPAASNLSFVINDNRNANFLATWNPYFQYSLPGGNTDWFNHGDTVRYVGGSQQFRVSAWLPNNSVNPGLTLSVVSRLKKGGIIVQNNTSSPHAFPNNVQSSVPIPFNVSAPVSVPAVGEGFEIEVDIIDSAAAVLSTKTINFTVMPEIVYTQAEAIHEATDDNNFFHDNTPTGLLGIMTSMGGIAARVASAINTSVAEGGIVLLAMTARHDSARFVETTLGGPNPAKTGYFAGIDYTHSTVDVAGAAGFRTHNFPDLGDKVIILNRTMDVSTRSKRSNDEIITLLIHEATHAMDVRPNSGTEIERYKTEFRAYWMDGRYGSPNSAVCPIGLASCYNAVFNPNLRPPGPKSDRARVIFNHLYNDPVTYPFVKQAYDNNADFREQVDNYIYPDGINLMVSIRLEKLRAKIETYTGAGFATLRTQVRQFLGLEVPSPSAGVLDNDEKNYISNSRAWRDLIERKIADSSDQMLLKSDLGIASAARP